MIFIVKQLAPKLVYNNYYTLNSAKKNLCSPAAGVHASHSFYNNYVGR